MPTLHTAIGCAIKPSRLFVNRFSNSNPSTKTITASLQSTDPNSGAFSHSTTEQTTTQTTTLQNTGAGAANNISQNVDAVAPMYMTPGITKALSCTQSEPPKSAFGNFSPTTTHVTTTVNKLTNVVENLEQYVLLGKVTLTSSDAPPNHIYSALELNAIWYAQNIEDRTIDYPNIAQFPLPQIVFDRAPAFWDYVRNNYAGMFDIELDFRPLKTAHQQGIIGFWFDPFKTLKSSYQILAKSHAAAISQMPHFQTLNLREDRPEMSITIPFASLQNYAILSEVKSGTGANDYMGSLYMCPLTPLRAASSTEIEILVYGRIMNYRPIGKMPRHEDKLNVMPTFPTTQSKEPLLPTHTSPPKKTSSDSLGKLFASGSQLLQTLLDFIEIMVRVAYIAAPPLTQATVITEGETIPNILSPTPNFDNVLPQITCIINELLVDLRSVVGRPDVQFTEDLTQSMFVILIADLEKALERLHSVTMPPEPTFASYTPEDCELQENYANAADEFYSANFAESTRCLSNWTPERGFFSCEGNSCVNCRANDPTHDQASSLPTIEEASEYDSEPDFSCPLSSQSAVSDTDFRELSNTSYYDSEPNADLRVFRDTISDADIRELCDVFLDDIGFLQTQSKEGPLSAGLHTLNEILTPMARIADEATQVIAGMSKQITNVPSRAIIPGRGYTNGTGTDESVALSLTHNPSQNVMPPCPGPDEMDLDFIGNSKWWCDSFTITDSTATNEILGVYPIHPIAQRQTAGQTMTNFSKGGSVMSPNLHAQYASAAAYAIAPFDLWFADSMKLQFQIACHPQHTAQLLVQYFPRRPPKGDFGPYRLETTSHNQIIDVSADNTIRGVDVEQSINSNRDWLRILSPNKVAQENDPGACAGFLVVSLSAPMKRTSLASHNIDVLVFQSFQGLRCKTFGVNTPQPMLVAPRRQFRQPIGPYSDPNSLEALGFGRELSDAELEAIPDPELNTEGWYFGPDQGEETILVEPASTAFPRPAAHTVSSRWTTFPSTQAPVIEEGAHHSLNATQNYEKVTNLRTVLHRQSREAPSIMNLKSAGHYNVSGQVQAISWAPEPMPYSVGVSRKNEDADYTSWYPTRVTPKSIRQYYSHIYSKFGGPMNFKMVPEDDDMKHFLCCRFRNADACRLGTHGFTGYGDTHMVAGAENMTEVVVPQATEEKYWLIGADDDMWEQVNNTTFQRKGNPVVAFATQSNLDSNTREESWACRDCYFTTALGDGASYFGLTGAPVFTFGIRACQIADREDPDAPTIDPQGSSPFDELNPIVP